MSDTESVPESDLDFIAEFIDQAVLRILGACCHFYYKWTPKWEARPLNMSLSEWKIQFARAMQQQGQSLDETQRQILRHHFNTTAEGYQTWCDQYQEACDMKDDLCDADDETSPLCKYLPVIRALDEEPGNEVRNNYCRAIVGLACEWNE